MTAAILILLAPSLYEQAVVRLLLDRFPQQEYLLMDARDGRVLLTRWQDAHAKVPVGSLWKPLLVAANSAGRDVDCRPGMCWLPRGHGRMDIDEALAQSCNAYFLDHASHLDADALHAAARTFAVPAPPKTSAKTLIGLDGEWTVTPEAIAHAYRGLIANRTVRHGMARSAEAGTAQRIQIDALAKTGTAPCSHRGGGPGDGYVVAFWPRDEPRYLLLMRMHGTTGAVSAETAGAMLRSIRDGR